MIFHFSSSYFHFLLLVLFFRFCLSNNINTIHDHVLCMDDERQALLDFKHALIDEANRLASWVPDKYDCCTWTGIVCDNITGHVHSIHLPATYHFDELTTDNKDEESLKQRLGGDLSPSLLYLKQLKHLDLSGNDFGGIQVPSFLGSLGNLRYLNLSRSGFGGTIPPQLGNLTELRILSLGSFHKDDYYSHPSELTGMRNMQWLSYLRLLHHLDMSGVNLSKAIEWFQVINTLPSLVQLHLSYCQLPDIHPQVPSLNLTSLFLLDLSHNHFTNSSVPRWIFSLTSLVSLDLSACHFHGPIPANSIHGFRNLTSLELLHVPDNYFMNSSLVLEGLSSIGGNLISLDLSSCGVSSSVLDSLHNMTSLFSLVLSNNQLTKPIPKSLGNFCHMRHIHLSGGYFPNISLTTLLESFFECKSSRLETLFIGYSKLSCHLPDQLGQLTRLEDLQLDGNYIVGMIPDSIGQLYFLRSLILNRNHISGSIPYSIVGLSSLEYLDLSDNQLNGNLSNSLGQLSKLIALDVSSNLLTGSLPNSIGQLSKLSKLDVSSNLLTGSLPNSLGQLSKLVELDVSSNLLTGVVTESHFSNLTKLKYLRGSDNKLTLRPSLANWIPHFKLQSLYLNSWDLGPQFPLWLQLQRDLDILEISNTKISSTLPKDFWRSFPNLSSLDMSQNQIHGRLFDIPASATLFEIDLSSNKFSGQLPQLPNSSTLLMLDLSNNSFIGSLRHLLCPIDETSVISLNLADNHLSGFIPDCWMRWPVLNFLNLDNNNLSGGIPTTLGSLSYLLSLSMCNNKLSGRLPVSIKNLMDLEILQLAGNEFVGRIPAWFGRKLRILNLRSNHFDGEISHGLCHLTIIQVLDLSRNNLSGNIPRCFNNFSVLSNKENITNDPQFHFLGSEDNEILGSASLVIKGREDTYSTILGLVMILDLSSNNFSGIIPHELMSLRALQSLNMSKNQLSGGIPENIGDMKALVSFDVSLNRLSGELPASLSSLSFLSSLNVSYNNLTGRIPSGTQLQSFNESSFLGNKLCGDPLAKSCAVEVPDDRDQNKEEDNGGHGLDWGLMISIVSGFIVGFWVVMAPLIVSRRWRITYFGFLSDMRFMIYDAVRKYFCNMFHNN